ncbi:MAG: CatB-related O-acetyltransferase [Anaerovoracaceae bacterium]|nr:CatB-related O-acetyltransferase [Anaerovoracaceae bacterium]
MFGPDPDTVYPNRAHNDIVFIRNVITKPYIEAGEYSFYRDPVHPERFEDHVTCRNDLYDDKLIIGKFVAIERGVEFIMNGMDPRLFSTSAYPFHLMGHGWEKTEPAKEDIVYEGDIVVGNDVLIGKDVTILPGTHICDGAVIGPGSCVSGVVPPYWVVTGNPAELIRRRFDTDTIEELLRIRWWDWPAEKIFENLDSLTKV